MNYAVMGWPGNDYVPNYALNRIKEARVEVFMTLTQCTLVVNNLTC
jgi:hypothetical protein